jgi:hypothetical protein
MTRGDQDAVKIYEILWQLEKGKTLWVMGIAEISKIFLWCQSLTGGHKSGDLCHNPTEATLINLVSFLTFSFYKSIGFTVEFMDSCGFHKNSMVNSLIY